MRLHASTGLTEVREARYLLDEVWNDGGVRYCLEQGQWHFAMRTSRFDYDPSITPDFGYQRAFTKPTDWVSTSGIFEDGFTKDPLLEYNDEAGFWFADRDEIFVRYVSDDSNFGTDFAKWPYSFTEYVKAYFAGRIAPKIPNAAAKVQWLLGQPGRHMGYVEHRLMLAKNKDAMALPTRFIQRGTWAHASHDGSNRGRRDGGNSGSLIG